MNTISPELAARPLKEIVESPKARAALEKYGLKTLGDVVKRGGPGTLHGIAGVGEASVAMIDKALGPMPVEDEAPGEVEEGEHPIRLESPYNEFRFVVHPARRVPEPGGGFAVQDSLFVEFNGGEGSLTKELFLQRKFARDGAAVSAAMKNPTFAWRREAVAWLQSKGTFQNGSFRILTD